MIKVQGNGNIFPIIPSVSNGACVFFIFFLDMLKVLKTMVTIWTCRI